MKKCIFTTLAVLLYSTAFAMESVVVPWGQKIQTKYESDAAAGVLIYAIDDGKVYVLLGNRDDGKGWCNPGGKAEDKDGFSFVTAVREVAEETMGSFVFVPEALKKFPSHCLHIPKKKIVYTMYLAPVGMIPEETLNGKLAKSSGHSKEYTEFKWILLEDLKDPATYPLMKEFSMMLEQTQISKQIEALTLTKELSTEGGRLHTSGSVSLEDSDFEFEEIEPDNDSLKQINELIARQEKTITELPKSVSMDEDSTAVNVEGISALELKCFTEKEKKAAVTAATKKVEKWGAHELSPTQAFLQVALGHEYVEGSSRDVLKTNLTKYIKDILLKPNELTRAIAVDEEGMDKLVDIFEFELQEYKSHRPVMYHGLDGINLFFYQYISSLHSLLKGEKEDTFGVLRGIAIPFIDKQTGKPYGNILEVFDRLGSGDYGKERNTVLLCANPILVLGPGNLSLSTSSSVEYFFNSHSVGSPQVRNLMLEMLVLLGMPPESSLSCYEEWLSLYDQFYRFNGKNPNGGLLAISMSSGLSMTHTMLASGGGKPHTNTTLSESDERYITPSVLQMMVDVQDEAMKVSKERGDFFSISSDGQSKIRNLTNEARIYLDPGQRFKVKGTWHYDLSPDKQKLFEEYWNVMVKTHVFRLLQARHRPIDNSLIIFHKDKYLLKRAEEAFSLSPPPDILHFLIEKGWTNLIESYLTLFPASLNPKSKEIRDAVWKAIGQNGLFEVADTLDKYLPGLEGGISAKNLLSTDEMQLIALKASMEGTYPEDFGEKIEIMQKSAKFLGENFTIARKRQLILNLMNTYQKEKYDGGELGKVLAALNLEKLVLFEDFFTDALKKKKFEYKDVDTLLSFANMGISLNPGDAGGKVRFERLLSARPDNLSSIDFYNWDMIVAKIIEKYKVNIKQCTLKGDAALLYKFDCCFKRYWAHTGFVDHPGETVNFIFDFFSKTGFLHGCNISYDPVYKWQPQWGVMGKLRAFLGDKRKKPYGDNVIAAFFGDAGLRRSLYCKKTAEEKFAESTKDSNLRRILETINMLDDIGVLFLNLNKIDDALGQHMRQCDKKHVVDQTSFPVSDNILASFEEFKDKHCPSDIHLFTDGLFIDLLAREKKYRKDILVAIKDKNEIEISRFSQEAPVYVMKNFIHLLYGSDGAGVLYTDALLNTLKRTLAFNPHLLYESICGLTIEGKEITYSYSILPDILAKVEKGYQSDSKKYGHFLEELCHIPEVEEKLISEGNAVFMIRHINDIQRSDNYETALSLFPNKTESFRKILKNSKIEDSFHLIYYAFKHNLSSYNEAILEYINGKIPETSLKNKDVIKLSENFDIGLALKNWIDGLEKVPALP